MPKQSRTSHLAIVDHLRLRINAGSLRRGDKLPSFEQLHRQFGVASHTVSKALGVLETDGMVRRRPGSGVYVEQVAPVRGRPRIAITGTAMQGYPSDYWARLIAGIQGSANTLGADVIFLPADASANWSEFNGVLWFNPRPEPIAELQALQMPVVTIGTQSTGASNVCCNEFDAGFVATDHLVKLGHRRIAVLGWATSQAFCSRLAGYFSAMSSIDHWDDSHAKKYAESFDTVRPVYDMRLIRALGFPYVGGEGGQRLLAQGNMRQWLADGFADLGCTALIAQNDDIAVGAMTVLKEAGYRIPDDVSVIGFDNERFCATVSPTLTSVGADMYDLGSRAVERLYELMKSGAGRVTSEIVPVTLYPRSSTAAPRRA